MKCPQCGNEVEEKYNFCPQCQAKLHPSSPDGSAGNQTDPSVHSQTVHSQPYTQNYGQNPPHGPIPGSAYDYYTKKNQENSKFREDSIKQPPIPPSGVDYHPPRRHTGVIIAVVIAAMAVLISLFIGLVAIIGWVEAYEDIYFDYSWEEEAWFADVPQSHTFQSPQGYYVPFPTGDQTFLSYPILVK